MNRIVSPPLTDLVHRNRCMNSSETQVFNFLNTRLPAGWEIYIQPRINDRRPDFVLLHPDVGIGIVEVKAWNLARFEHVPDQNGNFRLLYRKSVQRDFSNSNPVQQIERYRDEILDLYCPRLGTQGVKVVFGAVIFTSGIKSEAERLLQPWLRSFKADRYPENCTISGIEDLISGNILRVFPAAGYTSRREFNPSLAADLRLWLGESSYVADLHKPLVFTKSQLEVIDTRTESGYRRVMGPAGSGKSLVLVARAARLAVANKRVLVLTFNLTLVHYLRDLVDRVPGIPKGMRQHMVWFNFHAWLRRVCVEAGELKQYQRIWADHFGEHTGNTKEGDEVEEPLKVVATLVKRILAGPRARKLHYDAIFIDEGQDYRPEWVECINKALRAGGELTLVRDATQDIYAQSIHQTEESWNNCGFRGPWKRLDICYRIPAELQALLDTFSAEWIHDKDADPPKGQLELGLTDTPCVLKWRDCHFDDLATAVFDEIHRLVTAEAAPSNKPVVFPEIIVVVPSRVLGAQILEQLLNAGISAVGTFAVDGRESRREKAAFRLTSAKVKLTTIHSFKGIEARAMIVALEERAAEVDPKLVYTALSRLKADPQGSYLTVLSQSQRFTRFGKRWPVFEENSNEKTAALIERLFSEIRQAQAPKP